MALTVSQLAAVVGVTTDTIRFYDRNGLVRPTARSEAGYRLYDAEAAERLRLVRGARRLGLGIPQVRELLDIRDRGLCPCGHAEAILRRRLAEVDAEVDRLGAVGRELRRLLAAYPAEACPEPEAAAWPCAEEFIRARR